MLHTTRFSLKAACLCYCLCWFATFVVKAEVCILEKWEEGYSLQVYTDIWKDDGVKITTANIRKKLGAADFQPYSAFREKLESEQYYWARIQLENRLPNAKEYSEWIMHLSFSLTDIDMFVEQEDGTFRQEDNGTFLPFGQKRFVPKMEGNFTRLSLLPQEPVLIYFRGKSERPSIAPRFSAELQHLSAFYERLKYEKTEQSLFIGFLLMMWFYNVVLYFFERDKSFISYSFYLLTLVAYSSYMVGDLADWLEPIFFPLHPEYRYFGKLAIYLGLMAYISFLRQFLDLKNLLPRWNQFYNIVFYLGVPWLLVDIVIMFQTNFSYVEGDLITFIYITIFLLPSTFFIYPLFRTGSKKGYFILAGILFMCLGIFITAIDRGETAGFSLKYFKIGTILEIVTFSLGLAYRQRENLIAAQQAQLELEKSELRRETDKALLRIKISSDLHDDVGSILTGLAMQAEMMEATATEKDKLRLSRISNLSRSAMSRMRDAVWAMDARKDNWQSLVDRINEFAEETLIANEISCEVAHQGINLSEDIPTNLRQNLYLITKEALTNIIKHSNGNQAAVVLKREADIIHLQIQDNGIPKLRKATSAGLGMSNMRMRAEKINGNIQIRRNKGFSISVSVNVA